jgi:hypothetical protein
LTEAEPLAPEHIDISRPEGVLLFQPVICLLSKVAPEIFLPSNTRKRYEDQIYNFSVFGDNCRVWQGILHLPTPDNIGYVGKIKIMIRYFNF